MKDKIPFYNIVNMLLTGLVFIGCCLAIYSEKALSIFNNEIIENIGAGPEIIITVSVFAVAYDVGLIINRIGSVIIEDIFKRLKWIPFNDDYELFNEKKKQYPIMSTLSREYALSRTRVVLFFILFVLSILAKKWIFAAAFIIVVIVYYLSFRKHSAKIVKLMNEDKASMEKSGEKNELGNKEKN